jgi:hypothetical protein
MTGVITGGSATPLGIAIGDGAAHASTGSPLAPAINKALSGKATIIDGRFTIAPGLRLAGR